MYNILNNVTNLQQTVKNKQQILIRHYNNLKIVSVDERDTL